MADDLDPVILDAVARAAYQATTDCPTTTIEIVFAPDAKPGNLMAAESYRLTVRATIEALRSAGYAIVPVVPAPEMVEAGWNAIINLRLDGPDGTGPLEAQEIYRAMLAAHGDGLV
jgi:hypothetical protein